MHPDPDRVVRDETEPAATPGASQGGASALMLSAPVRSRGAELLPESHADVPHLSFSRFVLTGFFVSFTVMHVRQNLAKLKDKLIGSSFLSALPAVTQGSQGLELAGSTGPKWGGLLRNVSRASAHWGWRRWPLGSLAL